ncbi:MAG TPA: hypothetical protein VFB89_13140 [Gemmatimonadales bacterium]|nr:hypothetical protein [Gemmatimonadales bacterium]
MEVTYAVTFEFETRAPLTHRGTIGGSSAATCVARATREAQKALRPVAWSSMVCCLLERRDGAAAPEPTEGGNHEGL